MGGPVATSKGEKTLKKSRKKNSKKHAYCHRMGRRMRYAAMQHGLCFAPCIGAIEANKSAQECSYMNPYPMELPTSTLAPAGPLSLPLVLGRRVANIVLTAQVQLACTCAMEARERAVRAQDRIEKTWPATPVRALVLDSYRAQAQS